MGISEITTTPTITQAGLKLAAMRNNQHLSLNITHASFGTAKYNPDGNEKALKREFLRIGVASAVKINDKANGFLQGSFDKALTSLIPGQGSNWQGLSNHLIARFYPVVSVGNGKDRRYVQDMSELPVFAPKNDIQRIYGGLARMSMARFMTVPQAGMLSKSYKYNIAEDNRNKLPIVPAMIGGSLLFSAEKPFTDFYISLASLVGQRLVDSIDESFIMVNMSGGIYL